MNTKKQKRKAKIHKIIFILLTDDGLKKEQAVDGRRKYINVLIFSQCNILCPDFTVKWRTHGKL